MDNESQKPELDSSIFGKSALRICACYVDGYSSLKLLFEIIKLQQNDIDKFLTFPEFFTHLYGVCYQSTVINLSNVLVEDKDSINIYYLQSYWANKFQENHNSEDYKDLSSTIQKITENYSKQSDFYLGLKELRDKYIAHIDKVRFHSAKGLSKNISLEDLKLAYDSIGILVGKLIGVLGINPELINFTQLDIANIQFQIMIRELEANPRI